LSAQELPPGRVGLPLWRGRDLQGLEDPADRGGADPVAELEQLALDPQVSPAGILRSEPPDERGDLGADRRASRPVRIGPFPGDQAMPLLELLNYRGMECEHLGGHPAGGTADLAGLAEG